MSNRRWLSILVGTTGALLIAIGYFGIYGLQSFQGLPSTPEPPFVTNESIAEAKAFLPVLYLMIGQGLLGVGAVVVGVALFMGRPFASRLLSAGCIVLAASSALVILIALGTWDVQGIFIVFAGLYFWEARRIHGKSESAL